MHILEKNILSFFDIMRTYFFAYSFNKDNL